MIIVANGLPFIAMRDWNSSPEAIASSGWLHIVEAYIVSPHEPTCFPAHAKQPGTIDYAVVSNSMTPMVQSIQVDEDDPYEPHRRTFLQLKEAPISICELVAQSPTEFPNEKPTGPYRQYSRAQVAITDDIEEHAKLLMNRIEDELIHKFHIEHVCDHKGRSPYKGRAEGFKLKKLQLGDKMGTTEGDSSVV